jgi:hypothetical protein
MNPQDELVMGTGSRVLRVWQERCDVYFDGLFQSRTFL